MEQDVYELLWHDEARPTRGRPAALSRERIVAEAVAIADAEGLDKVSMKHLAEHLDCGVMSLYRHVPGKRELVLLMYDSLMSTPIQLPAGQGWRAAMAAWAHGVRGLFRAHPWALPIAMSDRPMGPGEAASLDTALAAFAGLDLAPDLSLTLVLAVDCFVAGAVRPELHGAERSPVMFAFLENTATHRRFPHLARLVTEGDLDDSDILGDYFEFGLQRLLDGFERYIRDAA